MPVPPKFLYRNVDIAADRSRLHGTLRGTNVGKTGASVAVLESETVGWGASSRNGGMVLTGLKLGANNLISHYGKEAARQMYVSFSGLDRLRRANRPRRKYRMRFCALRAPGGRV